MLSSAKKYKEIFQMNKQRVNKSIEVVQACWLNATDRSNNRDLRHVNLNLLSLLRPSHDLCLCI